MSLLKKLRESKGRVRGRFIVENHMTDLIMLLLTCLREEIPVMVRITGNGGVLGVSLYDGDEKTVLYVRNSESLFDRLMEESDLSAYVGSSMEAGFYDHAETALDALKEDLEDRIRKDTAAGRNGLPKKPQGHPEEPLQSELGV